MVMVRLGEAMSSHPEIDMMSFTGSTRAGIAVTKGAAEYRNVFLNWGKVPISFFQIVILKKP